MKLIPTLREKKRYVLFEVEGAGILNQADVEDLTSKALLSFLGELGVMRAAPLLVKEKIKSNRFVLKVNHRFVDELKSAMILIKSIKNKPVLVRSINTSGTLKKISEYL